MALPVLAAAERVDRARRIGVTFGRVYLGIKAHQLLARSLRPPDMAERWSALHRGNAESIYTTAVELRGMILKGCQFLGARADVLPPEYVEVLSRLQDRVPAQPWPVVRRLLERELGALDRVFQEIGRRPIASASLAQVHEGRLLDGRRVAVKVQYPDIASQVHDDLANLSFLLRAVGLLERDLDLLPVIEELGRYVPLELDFVNEGRNAEAVAEKLAHRKDVAIPSVVWEHSTERVLVMEFMEGIKISDVDALRRAGVDVERVAGILVEVFAEQVLGHGFFHADPHPGNLLVQPEGPRLVMLDFGLAKELPPNFRAGVLGFVASMLRGDRDEMARALLDLGFETRDGTAESLRDIADLVIDVGRRIRERTYADPELIARLRQEIPDRIRRNPIVRIPHHLVLLGRVIGLVSGVSHTLGTRLDLLGTVTPHAFGTAAQRPPRP